jgi:hypothetical protein
MEREEEGWGEYEYLKGWIRESREKIKLLRITITVA